VRTGLGERILNGRGPALAELLEALGEAITIRDRDDNLVYANRAALDSLGFASLKEAQRDSLHAIMDDYIVLDEHGEPLTMDDIPSVRLLRGEPAPPLLLRSVHRGTGVTRWELLKAAPLHGPDGELVAAVTLIEDVTAVRTAEAHTRILAESGRILSSSLDYQQTLQNVAHLAVPDLADWCEVDLVDEDLRREQIVIAHADPRLRELAHRARALEPPELIASSALRQVVTTGQSVRLFDVSDEHLADVAQSDRHLALLRELAIRSAIIVPMRVPARTVGAMSFFTSASRRRLSRDDVALAEQLARRAAVAVENARMVTALSRVSETLQHSLLPSELPEVPGWELAALYRPAGGGTRIEVGGDFYEVFEAGESTLAVIGDVTGHGVAAATLTALMRHGARFASRAEPQPAAILHRLDEELRRRPGTAMCTALCVSIRGREVTLCSAGHPPGVRVDQRGAITETPAPGPLLGAFADARWHEETITMAPGELLLLYTDGVTETAGAADRFGSDRLRRLAGGAAGRSPAELLQQLDDALEDFREGAPSDDVAALALRVSGGDR
jgi:PAS domain S-box-containing protein